MSIVVRNNNQKILIQQMEKRSRMNRNYKKRMICFLVEILSICMLSGCQTKNKKIVGYWMNQMADTIAFTDEETCSINDVSFKYKIYDENHIQFISRDGYANECMFKFEGEKLYLKFLDMDVYDVYTKDENEQEDILSNIKKQDEEMAEEIERLNKIDEMQKRIDKYQVYIEDANRRIQNNKDDIEHWEQNSEERIKECEEAIAFGENREYNEKQRDDFIAANEEAIEGCKERIDELEQKIVEYQAEIGDLEEEMLNYK